MTTWAVIIAVEDYPNIAAGLARKLPGTNKAAEDFRNWVMTVKNVPASNIIACAGDTCGWRTTGTTRKEIVAAFTELVRRTSVNADEVYVFFSGHGISFSEDPTLPAIDVLIGSEFSDPSTSGSACVDFPEVKEKLRRALGPGKQFYFIDACRNPMGKGEIDPIGLGTVWRISDRGNATTYVLFSTAPGDVANINSGFNTVLLGGLKGNGRAKAWVGGKMYVTFDNLCLYVQRELRKSDLEPEIKGPLAADSSIVELNPPPTSQCAVEVIDAGPNDQFTFTAADVRKVPRPPVTFVGAQKTIPLSPEDYLLQLTTLGGIGVPQIDPPPDASGVDLYGDRKVKFQKGLPMASISPEPLAPSNANLRISGIPGTDVLFHEIGTGAMKTMPMSSKELTDTLEPGLYKAQLRDGNFKLQSVRLDVSPGATVDLDFNPKVSPGAQESLSKVIPTKGPLVNFSETLSNVPDWDLSLWLAVLGASRILAPPDTFSKLKSLHLENFTDAKPGRSVLYVLAGELESDNEPGCDLGMHPSWKPMQAVPGIPGLFQAKLEFEPGQQLVTFAADRRSTTTILVHGLPNRATLLTFAQDRQLGRQVQQFILPIHSLTHYLSPRELEYLQFNRPLPTIRYMSTAQRLFALQAPIAGHTYQGSDHYWFDLLYSKWLDPVMALIACYELIRRGATKQNMSLMHTVVKNMRKYFNGFADTEVISRFIGKTYTPLSVAPLLMDGVLATAGQDILPLPEAKLEFSSIWTSWRDALPLSEAEMASADGKIHSEGLIHSKADVAPRKRVRKTSSDEESGPTATY
jgi:Caspase domain